jgi:internalin A
VTPARLDDAQIMAKNLGDAGHWARATLLQRAVAADGQRPTKPEDVVSLDLSNTYVTDEDLAALAALTNLASLNLSENCDVTDAGLKALAPLKHLRVLDLRGTRVTGAGLVELAPLTSLNTLHLDEKLFNGSSKPLSSLRAIGLLHALDRATAVGGKRPNNSEEVVSLNLFGTRMPGSELEALSSLKNLNTLYLADTNDYTLKVLGEMRLLHTLWLAAAAGGKRPAGPEDVVHLDLRSTEVTDAGLAELAPLRNLHFLALERTIVTDDALRSLRELGLLHALYFEVRTAEKRFTRDEDVVSLDLSDTNVTEAGLKELAALKALTTLNLSHTHVASCGLSELAALKGLADLDLSHTRVTDAGLKQLARLETLTALNLSHTKVTDSGLSELAALPNFTFLGLAGTKVTDVGLKKLAALNNLKNLKNLDLSQTGVTDAGVKELQKALPNCQITK